MIDHVAPYLPAIAVGCWAAIAAAGAGDGLATVVDLLLLGGALAFRVRLRHR